MLIQYVSHPLNYLPTQYLPSHLTMETAFSDGLSVNVQTTESRDFLMLGLFSSSLAHGDLGYEDFTFLLFDRYRGTPLQSWLFWSLRQEDHFSLRPACLLKTKYSTNQ